MESFTDWIEVFKGIDRMIVVIINSLHTPFLDQLIWFLTNKFTWIPLYVLLLILVYWKYPLKKAIWFTVFGVLAVALTDLTTTYFFKYPIARYRPSHNVLIKDILHFYEIKPGDYYRGGMYGFISGHAANSFAVAILFMKQLKSKFKWMPILLVFWAILMCFTRLYLGVHYLTDLMAGAVWGSLIALISYKIYKKYILQNAHL